MGVNISPAPTSVPPTNVNLTTSRPRSLWRSRLGFGIRTAVACAIVGCTTVYSPAAIRRHLTFPAFSYVTVILIYSDAYGDATVEETLKGAVCALYATVVGTCPAALTLLMMKRIYVHHMIISVAISSFMVALPRSIGLLTRRIALGQIVIVYIAALREGRGHDILIPAHVASCTAVGVTAAVLALVLPYPRLACSEVREKSKLYAELILDRLTLLVVAFCAENGSHRIMLLSHAKSLANGCAKLLRDIKSKQVSMQWERPTFLSDSGTRFRIQQMERLESIEMTLKGIEFAIDSTSLHTYSCDQHLKDHLLSLREQVALGLNKANYEDDKGGSITIALNDKHLPYFFLLYCINLLLNNGGPCAASSVTATGCAASSVTATGETKVTPTIKSDTGSGKHEPHNNKWIELSTEQLIVALKCSLSLSLAVIFGVLFSKDNGYWSGLTVAITVTPWRDATFKLANARAQGTALGSVYGVLGSIISQNIMEIRFLVLLPWVVLSSFLRHSHMYGDTGGIAAVITSMIIIGRRNYGSPTDFTITRLTETFIGLACSICVELLLQPARAATQARSQLFKIVNSLRESMMDLETENEEQLKENVDELMKYIVQAEGEPSLWFLPFNTSCYKKLYCSVSKMVSLLAFLRNALELITWDEKQDSVHDDLEQFKKSIGSLLRSTKEALENKKTISSDLEMGKTSGLHAYVGRDADDGIVGSFLQHARDFVERLDKTVISVDQVVLHLGVVAFCMDGLRRETWEVEKRIIELVQWENLGSSWCSSEENSLA